MTNKSDDITKRLQTIKLVLMDVDGTLTDGQLIYSNDWVESKAFDVKDGFGIYLLQTCGIKAGIVTGRESRIVTERAAELSIEIVYQGRFRKDQVLSEILKETGLHESEVAFIGDDLFDLPILKRAGFSAAPSDAHPIVRENVHFVSQFEGGRGAVREICEMLIHAQGKWDEMMKQFLAVD